MAYADGLMERPCAGLAPDAGHEELYRLGLVYSTGMGVAEDKVAAHKWFNLAALRGSEEAKNCRRELADELTTDELKQALKDARDWLQLAN